MNLIPLNFITQGEQTPLRRMMLERALAGGGALSEYEITGNPVAFNTNLARPLSAFTIPFLPVQSGTGDPSPSNVRPISGWSGVTAYRAGKNLCEGAENFAIGLDGDKVKVTSTVGTCLIAHVKKGQTYSFSNADLNRRLVSYWDEIPSLNDISETFQSLTGTTFTAIKDGLVLIYINNAIVSTSTAQIELGSTASPYTPFVGQSYPVTFPAVGKNLFDKSTPIQYGQYYSKGNWLSGDNRICTDYVPVEEGETYTFSVPTNNAANLRFINYNLFNEDKVWIGDRAVNGESTSFNGAASHTFTVNLPGAKYVRMVLRDKSDSDANITDRTLQNADLQFEKGSSATAYEPFTNTVYGGTLDAVNGVLTVDTEFVSFRWGDVNGSSVGDYTRKMVTGRLSNYPNHKYTPVCNVATYKAQYSEDSLHFYVNAAASNNIIVFLPNNADEDTIVQVAYPLATPIVIPLSDIPVPVTLIGDNTIWTDTNGENTVKYLKKG